MRRLSWLAVSLIVALVALSAPAAAVLSPTAVSVTAGTPKIIQGKLDGGSTIDLAWAAKSTVACFPSTKNDHFNGNHVLYALDLPPSSELVVTATPGSSAQDISLYGFTVGATDTTSIPPSVSSAVSCEASYGTTSLSSPYNPGQAETMKLNATTNGYRVIVGVAGAQGLKAGSFSLRFDLKTAAAAATGKVSSATKLTFASGATTASTLGKLDSGPVIDLAWAANSSVACFPATQNAAFNGAHVVYAIDLPAYYELTVVAQPMTSSLDIGLYGYTVSSTDTTTLPPSVSSVVSCEASGGATANPGGSETIKLISTRNPYRAYIGVAGANGAKTGGFRVTATLRKTN